MATKAKKKVEKKATTAKVEAPKAPKAPKVDVAAKALKTANEAAAEVRRLRTQMEDEGVITNPHAMKTGGDLFREKKAALQGGSVRIAWLVILALLTVGVFAANELVWDIVPGVVQVDAEGDMKVNDLAVAGDATVTGALTVTGEISDAGSGTDGTATALSTVSTVEYVYGNLHTVTLTCTALELLMTDEAGVTIHGGTNVYTYPEGLICSLGAVIDGSITNVAGADYQVATWDGDVALGTTLVDNTATPMVTTQQDILQNTAVSQAVGQIANCDAQSVATILTESGARWLDGTATAKVVFFNTLVDENATHNEDGGTNTFTGTIEFSYLLVGDN